MHNHRGNRNMLDVPAFARSVQAEQQTGPGAMAEDTEDAETAAERLEAALERIARFAGGAAVSGTEHRHTVDSAEIAARLDGMIERLRAALHGTSGAN